MNNLTVCTIMLKLTKVLDENIDKYCYYFVLIAFVLANIFHFVLPTVKKCLSISGRKSNEVTLIKPNS